MFKAQFSYLDAMVLVAVGFTGGKWVSKRRPPEGRQ